MRFCSNTLETTDSGIPLRQFLLFSSTGDDDYAVEMADDAFLKKVQGKQQAFLKGDLFEVTLEEIKSSSASRSDYKRVIKSVDRHFAGKDRRLT